jgi:hypothetical protein
MSSNATSKLKEFARRLLAHDAVSDKSAGTNDSPVFRVCEKLRGPLSRLTGIGGFRSLLSRALALAGGEVHRAASGTSLIDTLKQYADAYIEI